MSAKCQPKMHTIYECEYCNKVFKHRQSKFKHDKICKAKEQKSLLEYMSQQIIEIKTEHEKERQQHEKDKAELRLQIDKLLEKVGNNNNNIENQQINIININSYGKENLDYLSNDYINKLLEQGAYGAVPKIIKHIHFNPRHPENHNVKITNKKLSWAKVWKNNKWELHNKKVVISDMVDKGYNILDEQYDKGLEKLNSSKRKNFKEFQSKYEEDDKDTHKYLNKEMEVLLLNESKISNKSKYLNN